MLINTITIMYSLLIFEILGIWIILLYNWKIIVVLLKKEYNQYRIKKNDIKKARYSTGK